MPIKNDVECIGTICAYPDNWTDKDGKVHEYTAFAIRIGACNIKVKTVFAKDYTKLISAIQASTRQA